MKLYVAGYRGKGFGSGFIKWFTAGKQSHVSLIFQSEKSIEEFESIQGKGVHRKPLIFLPSKSVDLYRVDLPDEAIMRVYNAAMALLGCKYDWTGIYGFLLRKKKENPWKWFCSELVAYCLLKGGFELMRLPPWKQSPVMVCSSVAIQPVNKEG